MLGRHKKDNGHGRRWTTLRLTLAALVASLAGLIAVTAEFMVEAERTLQGVAHQAELSTRLRQLQGVMVSLVDAETGQRGYLLTNNERYLGPYRSAIARLPALMMSLDATDRNGDNDSTLEQHADNARQLVSDKLAELAETVRLQASGRHEQAMALVLSDKGQDYMERARVELDGVLDRVGAERDGIGGDIAARVAHIQRLLLLAVSSLLMFVALAAGQTVQTLSARTRFEKTLSLSEQRHRALIEDQSEMVSLAREDGTLVYVNPAFARYFGRTPAELVGANRYELADAAERDAMRLEAGGVLRSGRERHSENRTQGADGSERWVAWTNKRRLEPDGALLHSVGRDITERRRSERALRASQSFLHRTSRLAGIGGWEQDLQTGTGVWSEEVRRILEVDEDHLPRRDDAVASYADEARGTMERAVADCIERGVPWDLELPRFTATGRRIWVRTVGSLEFENGQPRRIVGALQDITERKLLEQRVSDGEHFLRQITDSLPVRIAYFDTQARYRFVNLAHCRRYGREREQIIGRTRSELARGQTDRVVDPHIAAVLRGQAQTFEYEENLEGRLRRIAAHLLPDIGDDGRVRGFYATGIDITERVANERRLRDLTQILDLNPDFIVQTDRLGGVQYMNPALRRALGLGADEPLAGRRFEEINAPRTNERYVAEIQPALREHGVWIGETTLPLAGGVVVPVNHLVIAHRDAAGRVERFSAVMRDISSEAAARSALMLQTATLQSVTEALPAMVTVVGGDMRYRFVNSAFERWVGIPRENILGRRVEDIIDPAEYAVRAPWIARAMAGEHVSFETSNPTRRMPHIGVTYIPLRNAGGIDGYVGVSQDITQHKEETGRLLQLTRRDVLTGLLNRAGFEEFLDDRAREDGVGTIALLYVDLDHFKPVNDTFGHGAGDAVLRGFAGRLVELVRPTDAVARLGGDEFAIALVGVREEAHAQVVAHKIVDAAAEPFEVGALTVSVGASVGVAFQADADGDWHPLAARADASLYRAKAAGRGTFA